MKSKIFLLLVFLLVYSQAFAQNPITVENIDNLTLRQVLGYGRLTSTTVIPGENRLLVGSSAGLWLFDSDSPHLFGNVDFPVTEIAATQTTLATGNANGEIRLWNVADETLKATLQVCCDVLDLSFDRTGTILASAHAGDDGVILWDASTGEQIAVLDGFDLPEAVDFSPARDVLAIADDNRVYIWDVQRERIRGQWPTRAVVDMAFSADDITLVTGHSDGAVRVWDNRTGEAVRAFSGDTDGISHVRFSEDGTQIAIVGKTQLDLRDFESGRLLSTQEGEFLDAAWVGEELIFINENAVAEEAGIGFTRDYFAFSSDSQLLFAPMYANPTCQGEGLQIWDTDSGAAVNCLPDANTLTASWRPNTHTILWKDSLSPCLHDVDTSAETCLLNDLVYDWNSLSFSAEGSLLTFAAGGEIRLMEVDTQTVQQTLVKTSDFSTAGTAFSPTGKFLATATGGTGLVHSVLLVWDTADTFPMVNIDLGEASEQARFYFDEELKLLVVVTQAQENRLWLVDLVERRLQQDFSVAGAAYHAESNLLVWTDESGLHFWTLTTEESNVVPLEDELTQLAFHPQGTILAAAPRYRVDEPFQCAGLQLWDVAEQQPIRIFEKTACVEAVQFSPDGTLLAVLDASGAVKLWEIPE